MKTRYRIEKCQCGDPICKDWHVTNVAQVQGVRFTKEQAAIVAATLTALSDESMLYKPGTKKMRMMILVPDELSYEEAEHILKETCPEISDIDDAHVHGLQRQWKAQNEAIRKKMGLD